MRRFWVALAAVGMAVLGTPASADQRIVGGEETDIDQVPWTLSLQYNGQHYCGAVLVAPAVALTAAHCTDGVPVTAMSIRAGSSVHAANGRTRAVVRVIQHPSYAPDTTDYDISVLRLSSPLPYSADIAPARVSSSPVLSGTLARVSGWGNITESGPAPLHLRSVRVPVVDRATCRASYGEASITSRMLCAGYELGKKDSCQGDSGGPLTAGRTLIGLVSWGHGCARPRLYGVYTNVANATLRAWITEKAGV
ncbi:hypothetical protein GCM10023148_28040 [Actinokineospora soli]